MTAAGVVAESHVGHYYSLDQLEGGKNLPNSIALIQSGEMLSLQVMASGLSGWTHRKRVKMIPNCDQSLDASWPERVG